MTEDALLARSLVGRFYRLNTPLEPGVSLTDRAQDHAWREGMGAGHPFRRAFCVGEPPFGGRLDESQTVLAYSDDGSGVWRLWLREEERSAGRRQTEAVASRLALADDPDTPLKKRQKSDQHRFLEEARVELLKVATPTLRVVPVVASSGWAWVGRRACFDDTTCALLLSKALGDLRPDAVVWPMTSARRWRALSMSTLLAFLEVEAGQLSPDVTLLEIDARGRSMVCKATDSADSVRDVLKEFAKSSSDAVIRSLSLEVYKEGNRIVVDIDKDGIFRATPPRSAGGLPSERVLRRFEDTIYAARRVGEVMNHWHDKLEND